MVSRHTLRDTPDTIITLSFIKKDHDQMNLILIKKSNFKIESKTSSLE